MKKIKDSFQNAHAFLSKQNPFILIVIGLVIGLIVFGGTDKSGPATMHDTAAQQTEIWTCSMHPQIQLPKSGQCPICGMDLIPLEDDSAQEEGVVLTMSETAKELAEIQTTPVERTFVAKQVRMSGKVTYDETRSSYITAWTGGRIDRLYIDQTGVPVRTGDHLAFLYSPELLAAQEEYLQALKSVGDVDKSHLDIIKRTSKNSVVTARQKLQLLGITDKQIAELEQRKTPSEHMTIYSPSTGIVVDRYVEEGDYVKTGTRIYSVIDLSSVWVQLDAYESDIEWLRYGQDVSFEVGAYPGEEFHGRISFINPILDEKTRTIKVRVNVDNPDGRLKPGMFVRAVVQAQIAQAGQVIDPSLENKWFCPMHPEVIEETAGTCPVCEMDLVKPQDMGYALARSVDPPLVIPVTAVLKTGKRSVVYLRDMNKDEPTFIGREITVGLRAGEYYIVKDGLQEGEHVVTHGNFKIDSALQIQAKKSMMNPEASSRKGSVHDMKGSTHDMKSDTDQTKGSTHDMKGSQQ